MAAKRTGRAKGKATGPDVVKLTVRLPGELARRLGVEAVMSGESMSSIVERVLTPYLAAWRLPSKVGSGPPGPTDRSDSAGPVVRAG